MISSPVEPVPQHSAIPDDSQKPSRLLVVDDHAAVRAGLRELLDDEVDFDVVAAVSTAEAAMVVAEREAIDVAVVDYQLGGRTGLWVSRKLKRLPRPPAVVVYSAYTDGVLPAAAVVAEADGIVSKAGLGSELCAAVRTVARGGRALAPMPPWLAEALRRRLDAEEQAIFGMLLAGIATGDIARTLDISAAGLETRLWSMLHKLEAPGSEPSRLYPVAPNAAWVRERRLSRGRFSE